MRFVHQISNEKLTNLKDALSKIALMLETEGNIVQTDFIQFLLDKLDRRDNDFITELNSENLWGGSGSIIDIEFKSSEKRQHFDNLLKELLDLMKNEDIMGRRANSSYRSL